MGFDIILVVGFQVGFDLKLRLGIAGAGAGVRNPNHLALAVVLSQKNVGVIDELDTALRPIGELAALVRGLLGTEFGANPVHPLRAEVLGERRRGQGEGHERAGRGTPEEGEKMHHAPVDS